MADGRDAAESRGYLWLALVAIVFGLLVGISIVVRTPVVNEETRSVGAICVVPFLMFSAMFSYALLTGMAHVAAGLLGGKGNYGPFAFAVAAYDAPLTLVQTIIATISPTALQCVGIPLGLYIFVLHVLATRANYNLSTGRAFLAVILFPLILLGISICVIAALALSGPAIGNVFSEIIRGLETP